MVIHEHPPVHGCPGKRDDALPSASCLSVSRLPAVPACAPPASPSRRQLVTGTLGAAVVAASPFALQAAVQLDQRDAWLLLSTDR